MSHQLVWITPKFLGFSFYWRQGGPRLRVAPMALEKFKDRVRKMTSRTRGISMAALVADLQAYFVGWKNYFGLAETPGVFDLLDHWIRRRLRAYLLHSWRHGHVVFRELVKRGAEPMRAAQTAKFARSWWSLSHSLAMRLALPNSYFDSIGLPRLGR